MAEDPAVSHDMSTTLGPGGYFGPSPQALQQMQQRNAAYNEEYQKKLRANQEWFRQMNQTPSRMSWVPTGKQVAGQGMGYQWVHNPAIPPGPAPDAPRPPMPYPGFQTGGQTWGGPVMVGENGPEIIDPPAGTNVYPTNPDDVPYWQRGGGYGFTAPAPLPMPTGPVRPFGGAGGYNRSPQAAPVAAPNGGYASQLDASLYGGAGLNNPQVYQHNPQVPAPMPAYTGPPGGSTQAPSYATSPYGGTYFPYELANWLASYGIQLAGLTGTYQATGPDGKPIGTAEPTYAANLGLSGLFGYGITNGMPTLAGRIAEDTRQQNVANFLGTTFGGTGSGYRPGVDNRGPSREFNRFIDNSMTNPADEMAWSNFVQYMQANLEPVRFGIIMRGEQVGNPTKGEQALMAGVMRRKGAQAPVMTDATGGV